MKSLYDIALKEKEDYEVYTSPSVTYVNRGSNVIHENTRSAYLLGVLKRIKKSSDVNDLRRLALANVGNENFPHNSWENTDLGGGDFIIMPGIQYIKDALYIDVPYEWRNESILSTREGDDARLSEKCNENLPEPDPSYSRYMNESNQCVPSLSFWKTEDSKKAGNIPGAPSPKNEPVSDGTLRFEASKSDEMPKFEASKPDFSKPDFSASLIRKESDEPGVEEKGVEEDGSSTLLYIAGAGILGAIAYVLLRK